MKRTGERDQNGALAGEQCGEPVSALCPNCATTLVGEYCHQCGQRNRHARLDIATVLGDSLTSLLSLDFGFLKTLIGLTRTPGTVCREYIRGKRKSYTNPVAYFVAAITLNLLFATAFSYVLPPLESAEDENLALSSSFASQVGLLSFLPLALAWTWLFRKSGHNVLENYVFALYVSGQLLLYEIILTPLLYPLRRHEFDLLVLAVVTAVYFVFAGTTFYGQRPHVVFLKFAATIIVLIVVAGIAMEMLGISP